MVSCVLSSQLAVWLVQLVGLRSLWVFELLSSAVFVCLLKEYVVFASLLGQLVIFHRFSESAFGV